MPPQVLAGQGVNLETFCVPVGDPDMKLEWFLGGEPLLFKSSFTPVYDYGFVGLAIHKASHLVELSNQEISPGLPGRLWRVPGSGDKQVWECGDGGLGGGVPGERGGGEGGGA